MAWFKSKSPEEKAAEAAADHAESMSEARAYIADRTGADLSDVREVYKGDDESLSATFNSLSGARENWGWLIAGLCVFGVVAAAGGVKTGLEHNAADIPYISTTLAALCGWGVRLMSNKIHRIEDNVKGKIEKLPAPASSPAVAPPAPPGGPA
jgi:hypothetical protein